MLPRRVLVADPHCSDHGYNPHHPPLRRDDHRLRCLPAQAVRFQRAEAGRGTFIATPATGYGWRASGRFRQIV